MKARWRGRDVEGKTMIGEEKRGEKWREDVENMRKKRRKRKRKTRTEQRF